MSGEQGGLLPDELDAAMQELFARPLAEQEARFAELVNAHPQQAVQLRARYQAVVAEDLAPPPVEGLERYRIDGVLGRGGMGEVLRGYDLLLERPVAIKVVRGSGEGTQLQLARFRAEAKLTAQLDHPGVVPVHDLGVDARGRAWFVMRLVAGESADALFAAAVRGPRELARALEVLRRACATIAFAHARGIVHRDLKPANLMVGAYGEVYAMDWGLAKRCDAAAELPSAATAAPERDVATLAGTVLGTPQYMPPERARSGGGGADPRADVYAVGAMLYQVLTGHPPYDGAGTAEATLAALRAGPPLPVTRRSPRAPAALVAICERAMARDPAQRYPDLGALSADLDAFVEARAVKAYRSGPLIELVLWVRRNRGLAAALLSAVSVLAIALLVVSFAWGDAERSRHRFRRLASVVQLEEAKRLAQDLHPPWPERIPALRHWLATFAVPLARERAALADELALLSARALPQAAGAGTPHFADVDDAILHSGLARHLVELADFAAPRGLASRVRERLAWAEQVTATTLEAHAEAWSAARAAVAADPRFRGWELRPQVGLVPLGRDPESGLPEFAEPRSGSLPRRGRDGKLEYDEGSGIVLVLVPGGASRLGAQASDPAAPSYWAGAKPDEAPVATVTLAPFLIGKHEITQAQWQRLAGANPSLSIGVDSARRPVGFVTWLDAERVLREEGMTLPTEAQWEHACRAGAGTAWSTGDTVASLAGHANVADEAARGRFGPGFRYEVGFADGWIADAPVGSFRANAFGLHDLHGNHAEWCLDVYAAPRRPQAPGTLGIREGGEVHRVHRGGSYALVADNFARCAYRAKAPADSGLHDVGLRAARSLR